MPRGWTYPLDESASDEPSHSDWSDTEEYREISFYKWTRKDDKVQKISITLEEDEAKEAWRETVQTLKSHIYRKRKQVHMFLFMRIFIILFWPFWLCEKSVLYRRA